jgi:hypothetical protein
MAVYFGNRSGSLLHHHRGLDNSYTSTDTLSNYLYGDAGQHLFDRSVGGNDALMGADRAINYLN